MLAQITSETAYKPGTIRVEGGEMRPDPFTEPGKSLRHYSTKISVRMIAFSRCFTASFKQHDRR